MKRYIACIIIILGNSCANAMNSQHLLKTTSTVVASHYLKQIKECAIVNPFFTDTNIINTIVTSMDDIENNNLGYEDYSARKGLIWSDVAVKTKNPINIIKEYNTQKITEVRGVLTEQQPQSMRNYPVLEHIVTNQILPSMFKTIREWTSLPEEVYAQIFFQRCNMSQKMDWHQDPGEDFDRQADYSLVLMLSEQNDPCYGWHGGEFKIRSGLPNDTYCDDDVETIIPRYNQAIIFNNQVNSHSAMEVIAKTTQSKRDIIVVMFNMLGMPQANRY